MSGNRLRYSYFIMFIVFFSFGWEKQAKADDCDPPNVLIVLDNSNSMSVKHKKDDANKAITFTVKTFMKSIRFGLMTFCGTGKKAKIPVVVKISDTSNSQIESNLPSRLCYGTPMKATMKRIKEYFETDFLPNDPKQPRPNFVMFVTDGASTDGSPVAGVKLLRALQVGNHTYDIKVFVVGFGKGVNAKTLANMALEGGTNQYYQANDHNSLQKALIQIGNAASKELCDNKDNDCDGKIDGMSETCQNTCGSGTRTCIAGKWENCITKSNGTPEKCNNIDDNCDGKIDENLKRSCSNQCGKGSEICEKGKWINCSAPKIQKEICNALDDDCDGKIDNASGSDKPLTRKCKTACNEGLSQCIMGNWSLCSARYPSTEVCNGIDDDCDGKIDNNGAKDTCRDGYICKNGLCLQTCVSECPKGQVCQSVDNKKLCIGKQSCKTLQKQCQSQGKVCKNGQCIMPCDDIKCPTKHFCEKGHCYENNCYNPKRPCAQDEICHQGKCIANPCKDVHCPDNKACKNGNCISSCAKISCSKGESCHDGQCQNDPCADINCSNDQVCKNGKCINDPCALSACRKNQVCKEGKCIDDPCATIKCPSGEICRPPNADCISKSPSQSSNDEHLTEIPNTSKDAGTFKETTPSPTKDTHNTIRDEQNNLLDQGNTHKNCPYGLNQDGSCRQKHITTGCSCSSSHHTFPTSLFFLFVLFLGFFQLKKYQK